MAKSYTAKDITVLEGLDPVRRRPGMYIGGVGLPGLHHLVWEILDNAVDEAMNGHASHIGVTLHADGASVTITDDGRGIPVDTHKKGKRSALEVIFTTLHAGGKFEHGTYRTAGGLHGVGASVVNALSKELVATSTRGGARWEQRFTQGRPASRLRRIGAARGTGTTVFFRPDATIFPKTTFDANLIAERLDITSYLHNGLQIVFTNQTAGQTQVFHHEGGIADYLRRILDDRSASPVHDVPFTLTRDHEASSSRIDLVLQWTESTDEHLRSYVNGIPTGSGGTHENGLRAGIGKAIRNFIDTHGLTPKGVTLTTDDIRRGDCRGTEHVRTGPAVPGADQGPAQQSRVDGGGRRARAAVARTLAEPQHQRGPRRWWRGSSWRLARGRPAAPPSKRSHGRAPHQTG